MADNLSNDIFKGIFLNENISILIKILLNFVPKDPIDSKSTLVQVMACRRRGEKPLPEPMMTQLIDGGRWVKPLGTL